MRFCYNCSRITPSTAKGEQPLFCQTCGRTFDTKYCHRLHPNPRSAVVCSQCGSKELSTPQPKVPFYIVPLLWLLTILPGFVLLAATVAFFAWFISTLISNQQLLGSAMAVGLIFALLWLMYLHLPDLVRKAIGKRLFGRTSGHKEHSGHYESVFLMKSEFRIDVKSKPHMGIRPAGPGQCCPGQEPEQKPGLPRASALGQPLGVKQAAAVIGCSPWTLKYRLLERGLPFFRAAASGKMIFYEGQIVRWIESQQKEGTRK